MEIEKMELKTNFQRKLTSRELDVLNCACLGMSNKEIAKELGLSKETVKSYMNKIFLKLNMNNRTKASMWFVYNKDKYLK